MMAGKTPILYHKNYLLLDQPTGHPKRPELVACVKTEDLLQELENIIPPQA
ncbi:MAG: hypothetical protein ABH851_00035 [Methanobacteriota archaeon]